MLARPQFKNEYACLSRDLAAVDFYLKWKSLEDKLTELNLQKERLTREASASGKARDVLLNGIKRKFQTIPKSDRPDRRLEVLSEIGSEMSQRESAVTRLPYDNKDFIDFVFAMYSHFDIASFEADWESLFGGVDSGALAECNGKIGGTEKARKALRRSVTSVFVDGRIPSRFRAMRAPEGQPEALIDMGISIVKSFVEDWTTRAAQFEVPVTITGIDIHTMPLPYRDTWQKAYEALRLGEVRKKIVYKALKAKAPNPQAQFSLSNVVG